jgi:pimeloyl-ACP methyl ester carboxylesterase
VVEVQPFGGIDPLFSLGEILLRGFHDQLLPNCWPLHRRIRSVELAVLIIHGGAADANGFNALATHLESDFTILSYDRRGLSRSVLEPGALVSDWYVG